MIAPRSDDHHDNDECDTTSAQGLGPCSLGGPEAAVTTPQSGDVADLPLTISLFMRDCCESRSGKLGTP
jgi:hypothetical protein